MLMSIFLLVSLFFFANEGDVTGISDVHAASIFRIEVSRVSREIMIRFDNILIFNKIYPPIIGPD
jgi:hypothetical protein